MALIVHRSNLNKTLTNRKLIILSALIFSSGYAVTASAVCPVCTVAVGAGVGLSRWLGVDDLITGLWLGGLIVSFIYWTLTWLENRAITFPAQPLVIAGSYYLLVFIPLYLAGIAGNPANDLLGIDKLVLGTVTGSIAFFGGALWYERLKEQHGGHAYFPFQKVLMPVLPLVILSLIAYLLL